MNAAKRYAIAWKGLKAGLHPFEFEVDDELFQRFENQEIKGGQCDAKVELRRLDSGMIVQAHITGSVTVECDRCLGDCAMPIDTDSEMTIKFADTQEYDGETLWLPRSEDWIDLAQFLYESIVVALPLRRVHPDGVCDPDMLRRFTIEE